MTASEQFSDRTRLLLGEASMDALARARVILFGVGGVGSWCAEGLVRSGVKQLTLVDPDVVCPSNVNRQLMATSSTLGRPKVEALRERLQDIAPDADIRAEQRRFSAETADTFSLDGYDVIIDAIDSLSDKMELILAATRTRARFFSSMGAALKTDPTQVRVAEFWNVRGCPLGAALRKKMRQSGRLPRRKFRCVYDEEVLENKGTAPEDGSRVNGSFAPVTAIFGMTLAALAVRALTASL